MIDAEAFSMCSNIEERNRQRAIEITNKVRAKHPEYFERTEED